MTLQDFFTSTQVATGLAILSFVAVVLLFFKDSPKKTRVKK